MTPRPVDRISALLQLLGVRLRATLRQDFPHFCPGRLEDAVSQAFAEVWARPSMLQAVTVADDDAAFQILYSIAWREARGQWRRKAYKSECSISAMEESGWTAPADELDPEDVLETAQFMERIEALVDEAAQRFGHRQATALSAALRARIFEEMSDVEAAARHGVPREYVNRSKRWMQAALA